MVLNGGTVFPGETLYFSSNGVVAFSADAAGGSLDFLVAGTQAVTELVVPILIKPGETPTINTKSKGKVAVAILSDASFDAPANVDGASVTFGHTGGEQSLASVQSLDVNGDGRKDLFCLFYIPLTGFQAGDTTGYLKGKTTGNIPINGSAPVTILK
jgi:hypothetical protein